MLGHYSKPQSLFFSQFCTFWVVIFPKLVFTELMLIYNTICFKHCMIYSTICFKNAVFHFFRYVTIPTFSISNFLITVHWTVFTLFSHSTLVISALQSKSKGLFLVFWLLCFVSCYFSFCLISLHIIPLQFPPCCLKMQDPFSPPYFLPPPTLPTL